jgi:hypothetical protein
MCISEARQEALEANARIDRACTGNGGDCVDRAIVDVAVELSPEVVVRLRLCTSHAIQVTQRVLGNGVVYTVAKLDN